MSYEALRAAIEKKLPTDEQVAAKKQAVSEAFLGPVDERPNVATLDKALALRDSDPEAFATLPAEMRRRALDQAVWRANRAQAAGGQA